jgi:hypothetical protein
MLPTILSLPIDIKNFGALVFAPQPFSSCYHRECTTGYRCQNQIKVQESGCLASKDKKTPLMLLLCSILHQELRCLASIAKKESGCLGTKQHASLHVSHTRNCHHHNHESCKSQRIWRITGGTLLMPESLFSQSSNSTA